MKAIVAVGSLSLAAIGFVFLKWLEKKQRDEEARLRDTRLDAQEIQRHLNKHIQWFRQDCMPNVRTCDAAEAEYKLGAFPENWVKQKLSFSVMHGISLGQIIKQAQQLETNDNKGLWDCRRVFCGWTVELDPRDPSRSTFLLRQKIYTQVSARAAQPVQVAARYASK